jgi:hypothetical protein
MQNVKDHASKARRTANITPPVAAGRVRSSKSSPRPRGSTPSSATAADTRFKWDQDKVGRIRDNISGRYLCLRFSRLTKCTGCYENSSLLVTQFGEAALQIDKLGRELTGVAIMRCITMLDEPIFQDFMCSLMTISLGVISVNNFTSFYTFKHGKRSQSMTPLATLWNFWKSTVRELVGGWSKELKNPTSRLLGNYSPFPLADSERTTLPEHRIGYSVMDVSALLSAAVVRVNMNSMEVEFYDCGPKPWTGWFGYFFDMLKEHMGHDIEEHTDKDLAYWIKFFSEYGEVSAKVSRQPIIVFFVYLEYLNTEYRHTNGKTFFPWYHIESVKTFKKWFTTVLQKYILVSTLLHAKEDSTMTSWEDHKRIVDHPLMSMMDLAVVQDRAINLATDGHFHCIKVCLLHTILFILFIVDSTLVYVGY